MDRGAVESQGAAAMAVRVDLATYDGVQERYERVRAIGRPLEALAVNAGVGVSGDFAGNDLADELRLINLNVTSAVHLAGPDDRTRHRREPIGVTAADHSVSNVAM